MKEGNNQNAIFKTMVFFLSSEVPRYSLEFIILCMGGKVFWEGYIVDLSKRAFSPVERREQVDNIRETSS